MIQIRYSIFLDAPKVWDVQSTIEDQESPLILFILYTPTISTNFVHTHPYSQNDYIDSILRSKHTYIHTYIHICNLTLFVSTASLECVALRALGLECFGSLSSVSHLRRLMDLFGFVYINSKRVYTSQRLIYANINNSKPRKYCSRAFSSSSNLAKF